MARQRLVKPDVFQHVELHRAETVYALPLIRAYIGLWCQADRRGCFEWKPEKLKLNVCPFDTLDFGDVLRALETTGFIKRYVVEGREYGYIPTFWRHQSFHHKENPNSLIPDPPKSGSGPVPTPDSRGASPSVTIASTVTSTVPSTASDTIAEEVLASVAWDDRPIQEQLITAANAAISAAFPKTSRRLKEGEHARELAAQLRDRGIPLPVAVASIHEQMMRYKAAHAPTTVRYFWPGIADAWQSTKPMDLNGSPPDTLARLRLLDTVQ